MFRMFKSYSWPSAAICKAVCSTTAASSKLRLLETPVRRPRVPISLSQLLLDDCMDLEGKWHCSKVNNFDNFNWCLRAVRPVASTDEHL